MRVDHRKLQELRNIEAQNGTQLVTAVLAFSLIVHGSSITARLQLADHFWESELGDIDVGVVKSDYSIIMDILLFVQKKKVFRIL